VARDEDAMQTLSERFWRKVVKNGPNECWGWNGAVNPGGYGKLGRDGDRNGTLIASRVAWELAHGPIPEGLFVLHHCDNPPCCKTEPDERFPEGHLFLGTVLDNTRDMIEKQRHRWGLKRAPKLGWSPSKAPRGNKCYRDHEFTPENTMTYPDGRRACKTCWRAAVVKRGGECCGKFIINFKRHVAQQHGGVTPEK
jgi:hypothetical protein